MKRFTCLFLLTYACMFHAHAQQVGLSTLLGELQTRFEVSFSYDNELLKGVPVMKPARNRNLKKTLEYLRDHSAFDFKQVNANQILVVPRYSGANFLVEGFVVDAETYGGLYASKVQLKGKNGTNCSENGHFMLPVQYSAGDSIIISAMGYNRKSLPMSAFVTSQALVVGLKSSINELNEVIVVSYLTNGITYDAFDQGITFRPKDQNLLPGQQNGDILYTLDALPGVSMPDSKAGNINIRGSSADQTLISFDHIPIYLKGHFLGTLSPFNSGLTSKISVQRSVMSLEKGGRIGGSVDLFSPDRISNTFNGKIMSSATDFTGNLNIPIKKDKISLSISGRKSYPFSTQNPSYYALSNFVFQQSEVNALLNGVSPDSAKLQKIDYQFQEAQGSLLISLSPKHSLSTSALILQNRLVLDRISDVNDFYEGDEIDVKNTGFSSWLESNWTSKLKSELKFTYSRFNQEFDALTTNAAQNQTLRKSDFDNRLQDFRSALDFNFKVNQYFQLRFGYQVQFYQVDYLNQIAGDTTGSFAQNINENNLLHAVYFNAQGKAFKRLVYQLGIRGNYSHLSGKTYWEPRLLLTYRPLEGLLIKGAAGSQWQFLNQITGISIESIGGLESQLWLLADDKVLPVVHSNQSTFGAMFEKKSWLIDIEGFYKQVNNITSVSLTAPEAKDPYNYGNLTVRGIDFLVRKHWKLVDVWASYTLSESWMQFDSINYGKRFKSLYNQPHVLDLAASLHFKRFKFSVSWKYRTGLDALPGVRNRMLHGKPVDIDNLPTPPPATLITKGIDGMYMDKYPAAHQLDASLSYDIPLKNKRYNLESSISCLNIYNRKNLVEQLIFPQVGKPPILMNAYMIGFSPNLYLKFSF